MAQDTPGPILFLLTETEAKALACVASTDQISHLAVWTDRPGRWSAFKSRGAVCSNGPRLQGDRFRNHPLGSLMRPEAVWCGNVQTVITMTTIVARGLTDLTRTEGI